MPNINVDMTDDDYQYLMIHKALFRAYTWDAYVMKACLNWPMKAKEYGTSMSYSIPPPDHIDNKKVTFRMSDTTHEKVNVVREKLGYTWREFLMYPSQHDDICTLVMRWSNKSEGFQVLAEGEDNE
jgi:hypothetical protein